MPAHERQQSDAELNEQLKLLVKTEKRLYAAQREVETQLGRIQALNEFALVAPSTTEDTEIVAHALEMIAASLPFDGALAVLHDDAGAATVLLRDSECTTLLRPQQQDEELLHAIASTRVSEDVALFAKGDPRGSSALFDWLERHAPGLDPNHPAHRSSQLLFALTPRSAQGPADLIVCRSASVLTYEQVPTDADRAFLKLACRHINSALTIARSTQHLERRVELRTKELALANAELERRLRELHGAQRQLVEASRQAGMAEVATSVLHNVGNVLNSVNVSANLVAKHARTSKGVGLERAVELLNGQPDRLQFLLSDSRGQALLDYISAVAKALASERESMLNELGALTRNIDHIRVIVSMQQAHAKTAGVIERLSLPELIDDALKFQAASYDRHGVTVIRDYGDVEEIQVDRHKLFQIMMNLLSNARHAVKDQPQEPRLIVRTRRTDGDSVEIEVEDNGVGIPPENLDKIFSYGFTTKREGHGFGLHSSACTAIELGGKVTAQSAGVGQGASFKLLIPRVASEDSAQTAPISRRPRNSHSLRPLSAPGLASNLALSVPSIRVPSNNGS